MHRYLFVQISHGHHQDDPDHPKTVSGWQERMVGRHPRRYNVPEIDSWQSQSSQRCVGSGSSEGRATADASLPTAGSAARRGVRSCAAPRSLARRGIPLCEAARRRARRAKASKTAPPALSTVGPTAIGSFSMRFGSRRSGKAELDPPGKWRRRFLPTVERW